MKSKAKRSLLNMNVNLLEGNILQSLLIFSIPLFISNIFQQMYNTADTMIVGNFLGENSLAAIGSSAVVYELLVGFSLGVGNGLSIVTARNYGTNDRELLKKSVAGSIVIGVFITIMVMIISQVSLYSLLQLLNTPVEIIDEAYSYITFVTFFVGVMFAYNLCAGLLRAVGNSTMPLVFLILSSVINIILDLLFITQFSLGIRGAAIATVISQGISAILCIIYIWRKCPMLIPQKEHFKFDGKLYSELAGQGFSMGIMLAIVTIGTAILQVAINNFGPLIIAGHTAARKLSSFFMMPVTTLSLAVSTFISQNKGANQGDRIVKGIRYANLLDIIWSVLITIILLFTAPFFVKLLSGSDKDIVLQNATQYLLFNAPFYCVLGMLLNFRSGLQGIGRKLIPLFSSVIEFLGKILFVIFIIPKLNYFGVIISEPIIWCVMCLQLFFSFYLTPYIRESKQKIKNAD